MTTTLPSVRALFCGQRTYTDWATIGQVIAALPPGSTVIHGGARGADTIAGACAKERGLPVEVYVADWDTHGKAAGAIRNQRMLDEGHPTEVYAFFNDRAMSRGTEDMIRRAKRLGLAVTVYDKGVGGVVNGGE